MGCDRDFRQDSRSTGEQREGRGTGQLKQALREWLRSERRRLTGQLLCALFADAVARSAAADPAFAHAEAVLLYLAHENEVPTTWIVKRAVAEGLPMLLPRRVNGEWWPAPWFPGAPLQRNGMGIWEPTSEPWNGAQTRVVAFVPVVAWDMKGARLGRGAAAYDRMLRALRNRGNVLTVIGLGYEFQRSGMLPGDPWDVALDQLITERRKLLFLGQTADWRKEL